MAITGKQIIAGALVVKLLSETKEFVAGMGSANRQLDETEQAALRSAQAYAHLGKGMMVAGGMVVAALGMATSKAIEFDKSMRLISTMGVEGSLEDIGNSVSRLAGEFGENWKIIQKGFYDAASNQIAKNTGEFETWAREVNRLALAGSTDFATASTVLLQAFASYGTGLENVGMLSDKLFAIVQMGSLNFEEFAGYIGNVMPSAKAAGLSIEELGGTVAAITHAMGPDMARQAITGLRAALNNLRRPSKDASAAAAELGIEFSMGAVRAQGFGNFLMGLVEAAKGNDDAISALFSSVESFNAIAGITSETGAKFFKEVLDYITTASGNTTEAADLMAESTSKSIDRMVQEWERLQRMIGSNFVESVGQASDATGGLLKDFNDFMEEHKTLQGILAGTTATIGGGAGAAGSVIWALAGLKIAFGLTGAQMLAFGAGGAAVTLGLIGLGLGIAIVNTGVDALGEAWLAEAAEEKAAAAERKFYMEQGVADSKEWALQQVEIESNLSAEKKALLADAFKAVQQASADEKAEKITAYKALEEDYMGHLGRLMAVCNNHNLQKEDVQRVYWSEEKRLRDQAQQLEVASVETMSDFMVAGKKAETALIEGEDKYQIESLRKRIATQNDLVRQGADYRIDMEISSIDQMSQLISTSNKKQLRETEFFLDTTLGMSKDYHEKSVAWAKKEKEEIARARKESNDWEEKEMARYYDSLEDGAKASTQKREEIHLAANRRETAILDDFYQNTEKTVAISENERLQLLGQAHQREFDLAYSSMTDILGTTEEKQGELTQAYQAAYERNDAITAQNYMDAVINLEKQQQAELELTKGLLRAIIDYGPKVRDELKSLHEGVGVKAVEIWKNFRDITSEWLDYTLSDIKGFVGSAIAAFQRLEAEKSRVRETVKTESSTGPGAESGTPASSQSTQNISSVVNVQGTNLGPNDIADAVRLGIRRAVGAAA